MAHGLQMCMERGFLQVCVDTDSMVVVNMLNGSMSAPWRYKALLQFIHGLMAHMRIPLKHQFREANSVQIRF